jgi:hypothetical protein
MNVSQLLVGRQCVMQSSALGNAAALEVAFNQDGTFSGMLAAPPDAYLVPSQPVNRTWYSGAPPVLILKSGGLKGQHRSNESDRMMSRLRLLPSLF